MLFRRLTLFSMLCASLSHAEDAVGTKVPIITLPVRVHLMQSRTLPAMHTTLVEADILRIFQKVNAVWAKAGIEFEIESVGETHAIELATDAPLQTEVARVKAMIPKERMSAAALDICYVKAVRSNGFYYGEPIVVKDTASLRVVPDGVDEPLPRVTAHEIGHALGLMHRQDTTNLMASGTTGFSLNDVEIATARAKAIERLEAAKK
jgi:hypothetical protein